MNKLVQMIAPQDREIITKALKTQEPTLPISPEDFMSDIIWRIYTELCCTSHNVNLRTPYPAAGKAFEKWIADETHFALQEGPEATQYEEMRRSIVEGVVARAKELFMAWGNLMHPVVQADSRNLRAPLRKYLPPHLRTKA